MRQLDGPQMAQQSDPKQTIAFQGQPGAYSDLACRHVFPAMTTLPCHAFEDAFAAVREGRAGPAVVPPENSGARRGGGIPPLRRGFPPYIIRARFQRGSTR